MNKLISKVGTGLAIATLAVVAFSNVAGATSLITVPTSTVSDLTANISDTIADPGLLLVILFVFALPVVFWVIHRIKGLMPKTK